MNLLAARRSKRRWRVSAVMAAIAIAVISAPAAQANVFNGPWDSAHQPASVTNPNIDVGPLDTLGTFIVLPLTGYGCPASATTTFADPSGSITETTAGVDNGFYCARTNTETRTDSPDFSVTWGTIGASEFLPTVSPRSVPFLYTLSDGTGVVAQGAYTWTYGTFRINSGTSQFNTVCLDGQHTLYSGSNGIVYCLTTEAVDTPGWPPPTPPPTPTGPIPRHQQRLLRRRESQRTHPEPRLRPRRHSHSPTRKPASRSSAASTLARSAPAQARGATRASRSGATRSGFTRSTHSGWPAAIRPMRGL